MKNLSTNFLAAISSETQTLTRCWQITRKDGTVLGFTSFSENLTFANLTYHAANGFSPAATEATTQLSAFNTELSSIFSNSGIKGIDLKSGVYDSAQVFVFMVNYADLPTSLSENNHLGLLKGIIGNISYTEDDFNIEIFSRAKLLEGKTNWVTSKTCRYRFGSYECGFNLNTYETTLLVQAPGENNTYFTSNQGFPNDFYTGSKLTWLSGDNTGQSSIVIKSNGQNIFTHVPTSNPIKAGDACQVFRGCNKTKINCQ